MTHLIKLDAPVPGEIAPDVLGMLYFASEDLVRFEFVTDARDEIAFELRSGAGHRSTEVAVEISNLVKKMCRNYRPSETKVLVQRRKEQFRYRENPHAALEREGQLFCFGPGRYGLGPLPTRLIDLFESDLRTLTSRFSAEPYRLPNLIGADTLERGGYLEHFPHFLSFVTHLREDPSAIRGFSNRPSGDPKKISLSPEWSSPVECLLLPSACFGYYQWRHDSKMGDHAVTLEGNCSRYESGNFQQLERLWNFTLRELIFVGSLKYVQTERTKTIEAVQALLESWDLSYEIRSANDPFFADGYAAQMRFQTAFDLKFEIRADLPYRNSTLAIGSSNYHQDYFGRCFNIVGENGAPVHTGCLGFGMERLALAFLAQHGPEPKHWPAGLAMRFSAL